MCLLLRAVWLDQAAPAELWAQIRAILGSCLMSSGLDSHFPRAVQVQISSKDGGSFYADSDTSLIVRSEVGVIEYPDGGRYAVAVFTRQDGGEPLLHDLKANRAIGLAARIAVDYLRAAR